VAEAAAIGHWLRAVVIDPHPPDDLDFIEPNLALRVAERTADRVRLLVRFALESAPPWVAAADGWAEHTVSLDLGVADVARAADQWDEDRAPYPMR
jgi:hypothetical protein